MSLLLNSHKNTNFLIQMNTTVLSTTGKTRSLNFFPPYNLTNRKENSDQFYLQLDVISKQVVETGMKHFGADIVNFRESVRVQGDSVKKSDEELLLEILMLGVYWNTYRGKWRWNIQLVLPIFNTLYLLRSTFLKKGVDKLRGGLGAWLLDKPKREDLIFEIDTLNNLVDWLSATGDFKMEVKMMNSWVNFLYFNIKRNSIEFLAEASEFASWFDEYTKKHLGNYTENVSSFLNNNEKRYRGREDQFFCSRTQVEYHINMVGAQIMNDSLKTDFLQTDNKILLLPTCMVSNSNCKAITKGNAIICQHCNSDCNISKTSNEMKKVGVETVLIKHSSDFSKWLKPWANQKSTGLIGTACVLNLLGGGYEMKQLNIPSQCVFLDYCGCKKHWDQNGIATQINIGQAKELVRSIKTKEIETQEAV
jgi:hypothetical protein